MFIRTERLLLRPGWIEDAPALAEAIADEAILNTLAQAPSPYTLPDAEWFLGQDHPARDAEFLVFARTRNAPKLVGGVGIHDQDGEAELGYWLARPYWGLGFATEAGKAVVAMARHSLRLPRLVSGHFTDNPASGKVLAKLGFRPTGRIEPRASRARGRDVACKLYALDFEGEAADFKMAA